MIRALILAGLADLAACSSSAPAPKPATAATTAGGPQTKAARANTTPRAELPPALAPQLPKHGYYAAGGGLVSSAWRVIVDTDADTIASGTSKQANASSTGAMEHETAAAPLPGDARSALAALAADAWSEKPPSDPPQPTADYDEIVVILDGDATFFLEGFGPIRRPHAAKLVAELRARAGL